MLAAHHRLSGIVRDWFGPFPAPSWHLRKTARLSGPSPSPSGVRGTYRQALKEAVQTKSNLYPLGKSPDQTLWERCINGRYANEKVFDFFGHQGNANENNKEIVMIAHPSEWLKA